MVGKLLPSFSNPTSSADGTYYHGFEMEKHQGLVYTNWAVLLERAQKGVTSVTLSCDGS